MSNPTDTKPKPEQSELLEAYRLALQSPDFPARQSHQWEYMFAEGFRAGMALAYREAQKVIEQNLK